MAASPTVITARKRDAICLEMERSKDSERAKCKHCPWEKVAVVERMKDHFEKSHKAGETENPTKSRHTKMENFVDKTSGIFCSDFPFRVLDFRYVLDFCVYEFKLTFRVSTCF